HCIHRTHFANDGIHIDHGIEEQTQEQPLIEEPEDQEPDPQPEEYPQAASDFASEKANLARKVWSSSSVLVLEEGPVITRSKKRHELVLE
ncbi:hypothetical protein U9M48_032498, partial [Paspalum notatum var. saurae]